MNHSKALPSFLQAWDACALRAQGELPEPLMIAARRNMFDTVAALAGGVRENTTQAAARACGAHGGVTLSPTDAAMVLGTASHALDYDDVCMLATCHPSAPVVAALLAMQPLLQKERPELTFRDLLAAYVLGTETLLRLGQWLGFHHYALGFHATSTLGTVGVAAAAAHVLSLSREQSHAALSIAASSACGLRANFGTDTKPLHVGFAASGGLRAVMLARSGASASDDIWSHVGGFASAFNGGNVPVFEWVGGSDWAMVQLGFEHKRYPSCYMTHRLIAGVLRIRQRHAHATGQSVQIEIEMPQNGTAPLKHPHPMTGLQAKFSGQYCAAAAWLDGKVSLATFTDSAVKGVLVRERMRHVHIHERDAAGESLDSAPVKVTIMGEGWTDQILVNWAPGSSADPMTREELRDKWQDCTRHGGLITNDAIAMRLLDEQSDISAQDLWQPLHDAMKAAIVHSANGNLS